MIVVILIRLILMVGPSYAQTFLNDFSRTVHLLDQNELDKLSKNPKEGIPGPLLTSLIPVNEIIPDLDCTNEKPKEEQSPRYEVIFVGNVSHDPGRSEVHNKETALKLYLMHLNLIYSPANEDKFSYVVSRPQSPLLQDVVLTDFPKIPGINVGARDVSSNDQAIPGLAVYREKVPDGLNTNDVKARAEFAYKYLQKGYYDGSVPKLIVKNENGENVEEEVDFFEGPFNQNSAVGRELIIEGMIQAAAKEDANINEYVLAEKMAGIIKDIYKSEEDRYNAVSATVARFYRDYNMARNPGRNNAENNAEGLPLPKGDLSLFDIVKASSEGRNNMNGVCNDFSEAGAILAEKVFPDKDVLTINSGSHFGIVIADGKKNRIIDGEDQHQLKNELYLQPTSSVPSLHISKVFNGKLKEIATVDTQMGQFVTKVFNENKSLLNTSTNINSVASHFRRITTEKDGSETAISGSAGYGNLGSSNVVMVVAKIENNSANSSSYIGLGAGVQKFNDPGVDLKYHIHLRTGTSRALINYVSQNASFKLETGLQGHFMSSLDKNLMELTTNLDFGWALEWVNKASFRITGDKSNGIEFLANVENRNGIAPENWGDATGTASKITGESFLKTLGSLRFYLNQINGNVVLQKKINENVLTNATLNYQGSNIGQSISAIGGLTIKAPESVEVMVFVGYQDNKLPGYMTKNSLLVGSQGVVVGGSIKNKQGVGVRGVVRGIGSERVSGDVSIEVPLDKLK